MAEWRDYRLVVELGIAPSEVEELSAYRADWLIAVHDKHLQLERERRRAEDGRG
ncbi:MAG: hypothetical protein JWP11_1344 [Frankiales bacterium]|nr:hypothetical protein [Frankiales bacterium]